MPAGSIRLLSRVAEHQLAPDEHAHDAAPRARASHPQTRRGAGCGATAPAPARLMVAVDMVLAAVPLDCCSLAPVVAAVPLYCCSLAPGAPELSPAFWLEA